MLKVACNLFQGHLVVSGPAGNGQVLSRAVEHRYEAQLPTVLRNLVMTGLKDEVDRGGKGLFKNKTNKLGIYLLVFLDC